MLQKDKPSFQAYAQSLIIVGAIGSTCCEKSGQKLGHKVAFHVLGQAMRSFDH